MVEFKANISDPRDGKSYQATVAGHHANSLIGKRIGDQIDGIFLNLPGYKLLITGGSDTDGFPMRRDLPGSRRTKILVSKGIGFNPPRKGTRRKKTMRGNSISPETVQINLKVTAHGAKPIGEVLKPAEKEKKEGA